MKKVMLLAVLLAGMVLVQGCKDNTDEQSHSKSVYGYDMPEYADIYDEDVSVFGTQADRLEMEKK